MHRLIRLSILFTLLLLLAATGTAITNYDIQTDGDTAYINVSFEVYPENSNRRTQMTMRWNVPENADIQYLGDSDGEITEYTRDRDQIEFKTTIASHEGKEVIDIRMQKDNIIRDQYNGLKRLQFQLSGFRDKRSDVPEEVTQVDIKTGERLLSISQSTGFRSQIDTNSVRFKGEGPVNIHLAVSDDGEEYENFVLFGEGNLSDAEEVYYLAPAVTGYVPEFNKHPVIVLPDSQYDTDIDTWSSGQYRSGGVIFLRKSTMDSDDMPAITMHEVMHAYNEPALRWTENGATWFDEGTAKYVEFLVKHEKGLRQPELFGDPVTWTGPCKDGGGRCRYTLPPRGELDQLWNYYEQNSNAMLTWSPQDAETTNERRFGYAFSELVIRDHISDNGFDALKPVYNDLLAVESTAGTPGQATDRILNYMGTDLEPCKSTTKDKMKQCLDRANSLDPDVPDTVTIQDRTYNITIDKIEKPKTRNDAIKQFKNLSQPEDAVPVLQQFFSGLMYDISRITSELINTFLSSA